MIIFLILGLTATWYSCSILIHTSIISSLLLKANSKKLIKLNLLFYGLGSFSCLFIVGIALTTIAKSLNFIRDKVIPILETLNGLFLILIGAYFLGWVKSFHTKKGGEFENKQLKIKTLFFLGASLSLTLCPTFLLIYITQVIPLALKHNKEFIGPFLFSLTYVLTLLSGGYLFHVFGEGVVFRKVSLIKTSKLIGYIFILIGLFLSLQLNIKLFNQW